VELTHRQVFERYVYAGAITRDPGAIAAMFTDDGVFEAPLLPAHSDLPRRLTGRAAIREGMAAYHRSLPPGVVDRQRSSYVLHETADPDVFIAEIDTVLVDERDGRTTMSLVQIFRLHGGRIASLRDYYATPG
jgi:ketosteroid isomerase-like protein